MHSTNNTALNGVLCRRNKKTDKLNEFQDKVSDKLSLFGDFENQE